MPMTREEHESILEVLLNPAAEQSARTEALQTLRVDYGTVLTDDETQKTSISRLQVDNDDLIKANSKLFRQVGIVGGNDEDKKKEEEKTLSQTITLESLGI